MTIGEKEKKLLWSRSGNTCAMPGCNTVLVTEKTTFGEMAHIEAKASGGPRGKKGNGSDSYENLILLCRKHHKT